jgi:hypothetical protein
MFRGLIYLLLLVSSPIATSLVQAGEVFRWTDAQGKVFYSDQPPPASAKQSSRVSGKANVIDVDKESYASRLAREKNPVVLYASACGPICDQARESSEPARYCFHQQRSLKRAGNCAGVEKSGG